MDQYQSNRRFKPSYINTNSYNQIDLLLNIDQIFQSIMKHLNLKYCIVKV